MLMLLCTVLYYKEERGTKVRVRGGVFILVVDITHPTTTTITDFLLCSPGDSTVATRLKTGLTTNRSIQVKHFHIVR